MINVGLIGYGKAGKAVASVLASHQGVSLQWVAQRRDPPEGAQAVPPRFGLQPAALERMLAQRPVQALVDFSSPAALPLYADAVQRHGLTLVTAVSAYPDDAQARLRALGQHARVMASPNITLGINFLILAARLLRSLAPFADVEIIEQHFREKPEVSGTARKIAASLSVEENRITSLRLGGIVGQHEVIFGFPHQTVRLTHDSIRREAFGTGAAFALLELVQCPPGYYNFDDLLMKKMRQELVQA